MIDATSIAEIANNAEQQKDTSRSAGLQRFCDTVLAIKDLGNALVVLNLYAALAWGVAQFVIGAIGNDARIQDVCWSNLGPLDSVVLRCKILRAFHEGFQDSGFLEKSDVDEDFLELYTAIVRYQVAVVINAYSK